MPQTHPYNKQEQAPTKFVFLYLFSSLQVLALSSEVVEEQEVEGLGYFVAYADGRVKVTFRDRTVLTMDAGRERCRLLMPDGKWAEASVANPVGVEGYVQVGLGDGSWGLQLAAANTIQST